MTTDGRPNAYQFCHWVKNVKYTVQQERLRCDRRKSYCWKHFLPELEHEQLLNIFLLTTLKKGTPLICLGWSKYCPIQKGLNSPHLHDNISPDLRLCSSKPFICLNPWWHLQYISSIKEISYLLKDHFTQEIPERSSELLGLVSHKSKSGFMLKDKQTKNERFEYHMAKAIGYVDSGPILCIDNYVILVIFRLLRNSTSLKCLPTALLWSLKFLLLVKGSFQLRNYYSYARAKAINAFGIVNILDNFQT